MSPKNPIISVDENGRFDWRAYARLWPIVAGILMLAFWLGGRLEDPQAKTLRIRSIMATELAPIRAALLGVAELGGHPRMHDRVRRLEEIQYGTMERIADSIEHIAGNGEPE